MAAAAFSVALCLLGLLWTLHALPGAKGDSDPAGVLALLPSLVSMVLGGWGTWAGFRSLQKTAEAIAEDLATSVARTEGAQYRQLLGSGQAAADGRIDLAFTTGSTTVSGSRAEGTLEGISDYYRELRPGRMVITGTPSDGRYGPAGGDAGTGKTVLALALILGLATERSSRDPVPVRLTAASWPGGRIRDWLRTHLTEVHRLSRGNAARVVEADLVLPVIDGLDEMDQSTAPGYTSRAAALLREINRFERAGRHCPVVVTCRLTQYQALVEREVESGSVAHIAVARVDAARAHHYLSQRVAAMERSRARWQPVLSALEGAAAGSPGAVPPEHALLAETLDTPWRLTLATTVFQERDPEGEYLRDPADLLVLADSGRLYEDLLDRYISAAVTAAHRGSDDASHRSGADTPAQLDADTTWRRLAFLARHLDDNSDSGDGSHRRVARRVLSSTDLLLHELWPLGGQHRTRWTERLLAMAALFPVATLAALALIPSGQTKALLVFLLVLLVAALYRPTWPKPRRIDVGRLRTPAGRRALIVTTTAVFSIVFVIISSMGMYAGGPHRNVFVIAAGAGLATGVPAGLARGLMMKQENVGISPRHTIRMDLTAALVFGPVAGVGASFLFSLMLVLFATGDTDASFLDYALFLFATTMVGLTAGAIIFILPVGGGAASLRYLAFLLHTRRRLPWRLGHFLDTCYELGILRVSGMAWQFRHRELQNHLAARPTPPSPS
ncbi:NACHT domain-containing protein [Streptomyces sp. NPDC058193]|uniref:NACHT domain-containing protein n=1 Tax=Streptomyces sp. NPDC058193 TaxID=3346373 RepID=UPI0036E59D45